MKTPPPWLDEKDGKLSPAAVARYARILRLMKEAERLAKAAGFRIRPKAKEA